MAKSNTDTDPLQDLEHAAKQLANSAEKSNRKNFRKYPFTFSFISLIGFASLMYGFERFFDQTPLRDDPIIFIILGVVILIATAHCISGCRIRKYH